MAGRRKKQENMTREEQLEIIENEIAEYKENLKALKEKRKEILSQIEDVQKDRLYKAAMESGLSIEEILEMLSQKEDQE
ncbi:flagellar export protein FliJ [Schaedlerella arabinosiphila]|jgi:galactokinase/mevalonate kinase-like predicted kinase|uniref:Flagellar export protein FliJ n=1 Tax=Schaedlerella arabinosiphila TaxID=2044587 RepID=A0A3R8RAP6_9FIRM|nr:flagellar export protein FliJ [Schaedlerella arabinosiphila]RRK36895.1 flagellar export protein FliJ [Schaedlerella arabinosiphila]